MSSIKTGAVYEKTFQAFSDAILQTALECVNTSKIKISTAKI